MGVRMQDWAVRTKSWDLTSLSWNLHRIFLEHLEKLFCNEDSEIYGIPDKDRMQPAQTNKFPLWPFWDKNHSTALKIHSWSKTKITPPFCHKWTKGKQNRKTTAIKYCPLLSQQDKGK